MLEQALLEQEVRKKKRGILLALMLLLIGLSAASLLVPQASTSPAVVAEVTTATSIPFTTGTSAVGSSGDTTAMEDTPTQSEPEATTAESVSAEENIAQITPTAQTSEVMRVTPAPQETTDITDDITSTVTTKDSETDTEPSTADEATDQAKEDISATAEVSGKPDDGISTGVEAAGDQMASETSATTGQSSDLSPEPANTTDQVDMATEATNTAEIIEPSSGDDADTENRADTTPDDLPTTGVVVNWGLVWSIVGVVTVLLGTGFAALYEKGP